MTIGTSSSNEIKQGVENSKNKIGNTKTNSKNDGNKNITEKKTRKRSRGGCHACKKSKIKCDELKPICTNCKKFEKSCDYSLILTWGGRPYKNPKIEKLNPVGHLSRQIQSNDSKFSIITTTGTGPGTTTPSTPSTPMMMSYQNKIPTTPAANLPTPTAHGTPGLNTQTSIPPQRTKNIQHSTSNIISPPQFYDSSSSTQSYNSIVTTPLTTIDKNDQLIQSHPLISKNSYNGSNSSSSMNTFNSPPPPSNFRNDLLSSNKKANLNTNDTKKEQKSNPYGHNSYILSAEDPDVKAEFSSMDDKNFLKRQKLSNGSHSTTTNNNFTNDPNNQIGINEQYSIINSNISNNKTTGNKSQNQIKHKSTPPTHLSDAQSVALNKSNDDNIQQDIDDNNNNNNNGININNTNNMNFNNDYYGLMSSSDVNNNLHSISNTLDMILSNDLYRDNKGRRPEINDQQIDTQNRLNIQQPQQKQLQNLQQHQQHQQIHEIKHQSSFQNSNQYPLNHHLQKIQSIEQRDIHQYRIDENNKFQNNIKNTHSSSSQKDSLINKNKRKTNINNNYFQNSYPSLLEDIPSFISADNLFEELKNSSSKISNKDNVNNSINDSNNGLDKSYIKQLSNKQTVLESKENLMSVTLNSPKLDDPTEINAPLNANNNSNNMTNLISDKDSNMNLNDNDNNTTNNLSDFNNNNNNNNNANSILLGNSNSNYLDLDFTDIIGEYADDILKSNSLIPKAFNALYSTPLINIKSKTSKDKIQSLDDDIGDDDDEEGHFELDNELNHVTNNYITPHNHHHHQQQTNNSNQLSLSPFGFNDNHNKNNNFNEFDLTQINGNYSNMNNIEGSPDFNVDSNQVAIRFNRKYRNALIASSPSSSSSSTSSTGPIEPIPRGLLPLPDILLSVPYYCDSFQFYLNSTSEILIPAHPSLYDNPFKVVIPRLAMSNDSLMSLMIAFGISHKSYLLNTTDSTEVIDQLLSRTLDELLKLLQNKETATSDLTLSVVMLLSSFFVFTFNSNKWKIHLQGARQILLMRGYKRPFHKLNGEFVEGSNNEIKERKLVFFLVRWFAYLDLMANLSSPLLPTDEEFNKFLIDLKENPDFVEQTIADSPSINDINSIGVDNESDSLLNPFTEVDNNTTPNNNNINNNGDDNKTKGDIDYDIEEFQERNKLLGESHNNVDFFLGFNISYLPVFKKIINLIKIQNMLIKKHEYDKLINVNEFNKNEIFRIDPRIVSKCLDIELSLREEDKLSEEVAKLKPGANPLDIHHITVLASNRGFLLMAILNLYRRVLLIPKTDKIIQRVIKEMISTFTNYIPSGSGADLCNIFPLFCAGSDATDLNDREFIIQRLEVLSSKASPGARMAIKVVKKCWATNSNWFDLMFKDKIDAVIV